MEKINSNWNIVEEAIGYILEEKGSSFQQQDEIVQLGTVY